MSGVIVLAYSGGLDTSVCIPLLRERYGFERVITVLTDVGQPKEDIERGNKRAEKLSDEHYVIDAKEEFVTDYIFPAIKANGSYEGYVLGTAIARPLIAKKTVDGGREGWGRRSWTTAAPGGAHDPTWVVTTVSGSIPGGGSVSHSPW